MATIDLDSLDAIYPIDAEQYMRSFLVIYFVAICEARHDVTISSCGRYQCNYRT